MKESPAYRGHATKNYLYEIKASVYVAIKIIYQVCTYNFSFIARVFAAL